VTRERVHRPLESHRQNCGVITEHRALGMKWVDGFVCETIPSLPQ